MMSEERWATLLNVLETVLELPDDLRSGQIAVMCGHDTELRDEAERLLCACTAAAADDAFLRNAAEYASPIIADLESTGEAYADADQVRERIAAALEHSYRIEADLGSGGMALVFLARDLRHDRHVALKVMKPGLLAGTVAERFLREIRIVAGLTHPHILPLHDSGEAAGLLYHLSAYIEGESLRARLRREGALPVHDALRTLRDVASALDYAHRRGIVHRDIKPDNILLQAGHAVVADFGIARAFGRAIEEQSDQDAAETITREGWRLGTPAYMAPEQAAANPGTDHRADLYALGVVGYEMLSGKRPFAESEPEELLTAQLTREPARVERPDVPPAVAAVVQRLLAKRPEDRYQSARELLDELERISRDPAAGPTSRAHGSAAPHRRKAMVAGATVPDEVLNPRPQARGPLDDVVSATADGESAVQHLTVHNTTHFGRVRRLGPALTMACVVLLLGAALWFKRTPAQVATAILVLPFENRTDEPQLDAFGRIAADWIAEGLDRAALGEVLVSPVHGSKAVQPRGTPDLGPAEMARETGAGIYVHGTVTRSGDSISVYTTIGRADGRLIGSFTTSGPNPADLLGGLRQEAVGALAAALDTRVAPLLEAGVKPPRYDSYLAYVEGVELRKRGDIRGAERELRRSAALDSGFVQAPFLLASIGADADTLLERVWARVERLSAYERVELERVTALQRLDREAELAAARREVAMAPRTPDALLNNAAAALNAGYYREAMRLLRRMESQPERYASEAYFELAGLIYHNNGEFANELRLVERARQMLGYSSEATCLHAVEAAAAMGREALMDSAATACAATYPPGHPLLLRPFVIGSWEARGHGHAEAAQRIARSGIEWYLSGRYHVGGAAGPPATMPLSNLYADSGEPQKSYDIMRAIKPQPPMEMAPLERCRYGLLAARTVDAPTASLIARSLAGLGEESGSNASSGEILHCRAQLAAWLGARDEAVRLLRLASARGYPQHTFHRNPGFASLRDYPPFLEVIRSRD